MEKVSHFCRACGSTHLGEATTGSGSMPSDKDFSACEERWSLRLWNEGDTCLPIHSCPHFVASVLCSACTVEYFVGADHIPSAANLHRSRSARDAAIRRLLRSITPSSDAMRSRWSAVFDIDSVTVVESRLWRLPPALPTRLRVVSVQKIGPFPSPFRDLFGNCSTFFSEKKHHTNGTKGGVNDRIGSRLGRGVTSHHHHPDNTQATPLSHHQNKRRYHEVEAAKSHYPDMPLDLRIPAPKRLWGSPLQPPGIPTRFLL